MFNTLFTSIFHSTTVNKESVAQEKPMMLSLKDILSASQHDNTLRLEIITVDAPHSMHITLSPPPLPDQPLVMVPLSIDIPADCPTKPIVRLNTPSTPYAQKWNPRLFDQDQMSAELQQTHSIPQWIHWLYNKMTTADSYPMKRSHDFNEDSYPSKAIKMEIDE
ncbi:hypothetical protein CU098_004121 [Rhizopus stolonifer]|uniref:Uncharacterized protein n=1 Tax=Rhizopus stolonifer TaxID=4846 RepID=A0A367J9Z6_RHIST|nr:hypothetical protein CU098_004121 [Rhizopus stolonifer]